MTDQFSETLVCCLGSHSCICSLGYTQFWANTFLNFFIFATFLMLWLPEASILLSRKIGLWFAHLDGCFPQMCLLCVQTAGQLRKKKRIGILFHILRTTVYHVREKGSFSSEFKYLPSCRCPALPPLPWVCLGLEWRKWEEKVFFSYSLTLGISLLCCSDQK